MEEYEAARLEIASWMHRLLKLAEMSDYVLNHNMTLEMAAKYVLDSQDCWPFIDELMDSEAEDELISDLEAWLIANLMEDADNAGYDGLDEWYEDFQNTAKVIEIALESEYYEMATGAISSRVAAFPKRLVSYLYLMNQTLITGVLPVGAEVYIESYRQMERDIGDGKYPGYGPTASPN